MTPQSLFTIGHSSHPLERLAALLREHGVTQVADVRRWPRSHRHPHFDDDALAVELAPHGIAYAHLVELGGHRDPLPGSANDGWETPAFNGYADHLASPEFARGLARLHALAERPRTPSGDCPPTPRTPPGDCPPTPRMPPGDGSSTSRTASGDCPPAVLGDSHRGRVTAVMCAEGDWRRCHRRLLADVLVARGVAVCHIAPDGRVEPHVPTDFAVVQDGLPRYPAAQLGLGF